MRIESSALSENSQPYMPTSTPSKSYTDSAMPPLASTADPYTAAYPTPPTVDQAPIPDKPKKATKKHKKGPNGRPFTDPDFKPPGRPFSEDGFKPKGRPFNMAAESTEPSTSKIKARK